MLPLDPVVVLGMLFSLIVLAMVGGFILLFPITRRLGAILEQRLNEKRPTSISSNQVRELEAAIQALRTDVDHLVERQEFAESLLQERNSLRLPES